MIMVREGYVLAAIIVAITSLHACRDNLSKKASGKETAEKENKEKFNSEASAKDAQFVVDQVSANLEEIELSELATAKGNNEELKTIAVQLKAAHEQLLEELQDYAQKKDMSIPGSPTVIEAKHIEQQENSNVDSDKDWIEALMQKHKKSIDRLESAAAGISDAELKNWVAKALPKLRTHHDKLMAFHHKLN